MSEQVTTNAPDPADVGSRIDPVLARSWLLVNGAQADRFPAAAHSRADIVVLDIEDAVAPEGQGRRPRQRRAAGSATATPTGCASTASAPSGGPTT